MASRLKTSARGHRKSSSIGLYGKLKTSGEVDTNLWSSLLDNAGGGKKLPGKTLLVLGGNPETQREFLDTLSSDVPKRTQERNKRKPPIANEFALGYTYRDVLDADHEDILARLSIYLLSKSSLSFAPLIKPLFTPQLIPDMLIVILLDWNEPWNWVRQLRNWVFLLKSAIASLNDDSKAAMAETMKDWQQPKRANLAPDAGTGGRNIETNITIPLSQGEWDEGLGLPLCVVCHGTERMDYLEKEQGWREDEFDFILQFLRTILMKHGASLIYTSVNNPNSLPALVHSSLEVHSLLKKQNLKHNVVDRDKILIPPNWDSWGKIRVLREGFDVEGISKGWSIDIQQSPSLATMSEHDRDSEDDESEDRNKSDELLEVLRLYENNIKDPRPNLAREPKRSRPRIEVEAANYQEFLASQQENIERLKAEDENHTRSSKEPKGLLFETSNSRGGSKRVDEHIGPVQFNMGGIQVDSEGMLNLTKDQESNTQEKAVDVPATPDGKSQNEALASFFAGLIKRGGTSSPKSVAS